MSQEIQTIPDGWMQDIEDAIHNPEQFKYAGWPSDAQHNTAKARAIRKIIPALLLEQFDKFHTRATAHAKTKWEHEAAALFHFYIIWRYKLWMAETKTWEEYVREVAKTPFAMSASTIKHRIGQINRFIERGTTVDNTFKLIGLVPTAAELMQNIPNEQLPGGDINQAAAQIIELGPGDAIVEVSEWQGMAQYVGLSAVHETSENALYMEVRRTRSGKEWDLLQFRVNNIDAEAADWFMARCNIRGDRRVFK